jgi:Ni2+-binding GTPase involved in maturation of urease and hydrogenase
VKVTVCPTMTLPATIPITVFTGFLGAGKTSIILSLLPQLPNDYKVVLLKNEFGDVEGKLRSFDILTGSGSSVVGAKWIANSHNNRVSRQSGRS